MTRRLVIPLLATALLLPVASIAGQDKETPRRLRILVSNDDGYQAPGLLALVDSLLPLADITVVAPLEQQSGTGHGITYREPIIIQEAGNPQAIPWYTVSARPATVVRVALRAILDSLPDLVVAGINTGDNLGTSAWISGTAAAAREAALVGIPALAFSVDPFGTDPYRVAAGWARRIVEQLEAEGRLRAPLLLNVNLQGEEPLGIRVAPMSMQVGEQEYDRRVSPGGQVYLWDMWEPPEDDPIEGTDLYWFVRGYVTITPLSVDQTEAALLGELEPLLGRP
jgi:5'-nucleotidase